MRAACVTVGLIVGVALSVSPLQAQVITGPETGRKGAKSAAQGVADSLGTGLDWLSWSEDEVVARMVHDPIKLLGMARFGSQGMELKGVVLEAETRVRATVRALSAGEVEAGAARRSMDEALDGFRSAVGELLEAS